MPIVIGVHPQSHKSHTKKSSEISPMINEHLNPGHWHLGGDRKKIYFASGGHSIHKVTIYKAISPLRILGIPPTFLSPNIPVTRWYSWVDHDGRSSTLVQGIILGLPLSLVLAKIPRSHPRTCRSRRVLSSKAEPQSHGRPRRRTHLWPPGLAIGYNCDGHSYTFLR